jgi:predicted RND superfamily exporter protein
MDYVEFVDGVRDHVDPVLAGFRQQGVQGVRPIYTGLMPVVYKAQQELFDSLFSSFLMAFGLIAIVMIVLLRGIVAGMVSMIPNIFPAVVIFGGMGWGNVLIDIGSMMTASVAMGVAVDDTIHFLTWFRRGLGCGMLRRDAIKYAYNRCANAMMQTTIIAGVGLSVFAFSTFKPTQRFGVLMLTMLVAAVVGDLILMPALLASPLGRFFERKRKRPAEGELLERWPLESAAAGGSSESAVGPPHRTRARPTSAAMSRQR